MTNGQQVPEDIYFPDAYALIEQCATELEDDYEYNNGVDSDEWVAEGYA